MLTKNVAALPLESQIPVIAQAVMTHQPEELAYNIQNRTFITPEDKAARVAANAAEIDKINAQITAGFFRAV